MMQVTLRNGRAVQLAGKGPLGRILVGRAEDGSPMSWHLSGRWRWDDVDHPLDIVEGFQP
jgi:hypothetical protein